MTKVLACVRPKTLDFFTNVINKVFDDAEITSFSDFAGNADRWAGDFLYKDKYDADNDEFEKVWPDIHARCRTLRVMDADLAHKIARRYWNGISELMNEGYQYVTMFPVDCYTSDIISRVARARGVRVIACCASIFSGYVKVTERGEYTTINRKVDSAELDYWLSRMLKKDFLPDTEKKNVRRKHSGIFKYYFRRKIIEDLYYPLKKWKEKDPWNYHYNMLYLRGKRIAMYYNRKIDSSFRHIEDCIFDRNLTVYMPLHLVPEATTDYWADNAEEAREYCAYIIGIIKKADPQITFIIKEHPAMYGRRELSFYKTLNSMKNVILIHPQDRSNNLLEMVDNVLVDNGTVGVEALLRGKRVLCLSSNYYFNFHPNAHRIESLHVEDLNKPLVDYSPAEFLRPLLEGVFPSDYDIGKSTQDSDPDALAEGIKRYITANA